MSMKVDYLKMQEREIIHKYDELVDIIMEDVDITFQECVKVLPNYMSRIRNAKREDVLRDVYMHDKSIVWIRWNYGFNNYARVEQMLATGIKDLKKFMLEDYPAKKKDN